MIESYNKIRPKESTEARIVVTSLEFLLENWRKTVDPALAKMQLMANQSVLDEAKAVTGGS